MSYPLPLCHVLLKTSVGQQAHITSDPSRPTGNPHYELRSPTREAFHLSLAGQRGCYRKDGRCRRDDSAGAKVFFRSGDHVSCKQPKKQEKKKKNRKCKLAKFFQQWRFGVFVFIF